MQKACCSSCCSHSCRKSNPNSSPSCLYFQSGIESVGVLARMPQSVIVRIRTQAWMPAWCVQAMAGPSLHASLGGGGARVARGLPSACLEGPPGHAEAHMVASFLGLFSVFSPHSWTSSRVTTANPFCNPLLQLDSDLSLLASGYWPLDPWLLWLLCCQSYHRHMFSWADSATTELLVKSVSSTWDALQFLLYVVFHDLVRPYPPVTHLDQ